MGGTWVVGVFLAAGASIISNIGLTLQKLNHLNNQRSALAMTTMNSSSSSTSRSSSVGPSPLAEGEEGDDEEQVSSEAHAYQRGGYSPDTLDEDSNSARSRSSSRTPLHRSSAEADEADEAMKPEEINYAKQKLWLVGLALIILGSLGDFAALGFASQAVVAPLGSFTLVSNVLLAPFLLGERIERRDLASTLLIVLGCTLAVAFAPHSEHTNSLSELYLLFTTTRFIIYAIAVVGTVSGMVTFVKVCERLKAAADRASASPADVAAYAEKVRFHRFSIAALAGIVGAQSVLFAKCTAELLVASFRGDGLLFAHWQTFLVLTGMGACIFLQIRWLNTALVLFDSLYVVPVFQSFWIIVSVLSGLIFFGEYRSLFSSENPTAAFGFPFGIACTVAGVYFLSQREASKKEEAAVHEGFHRLHEDEDVEAAAAAATAAAAAVGGVGVLAEADTEDQFSEDGATGADSGSAVAGAARARARSHTASGSDAHAFAARQAAYAGDADDFRPHPRDALLHAHSMRHGARSERVAIDRPHGVSHAHHQQRQNASKLSRSLDARAHPSPGLLPITAHRRQSVTGDLSEQLLQSPANRRPVAVDVLVDHPSVLDSVLLRAHLGTLRRLGVALDPLVVPDTMYAPAPSSSGATAAASMLSPAPAVSPSSASSASSSSSLSSSIIAALRSSGTPNRTADEGVNEIALTSPTLHAAPAPTGAPPTSPLPPASSTGSP